MATRILLAVDGSPYSEAATQVAADLLAADPHTELTALHVVNVVEASGNLLKDLPGRLGFEPAVVRPEVHDAHEAAGREQLAAVKAAAEARGREATTVLEHGAVVERIVHWAARFDLLILGLRGETEARHPGQGGGSVHTVLSETTTPALLVARGTQRLTGVALGYDGSEAARRALAAALPLARQLKLPVHAIFVGEAHEFEGIRGGLERELGGHPHEAHVVQGESVHRALAEAAEASAANLLVMGFRGQNPMRDFLFGSSTEFIVESTSLNLLIAQ
jgi:nucleotide-binding universal stress UspA family protein